MSEPAPTSARNAVVSAALDLFVAQGFESTSVEQIAQAAGVSRSTFFRQFGGKIAANDRFGTERNAPLVGQNDRLDGDGRGDAAGARA